MTRRSVQLRLALVLGLVPAALVLPSRGQNNTATGNVPPSVSSSAPKLTVDVAAIDRDRILKAANAALTLEPVTISKFHARLSEGGSNDFYSNGDYWWPDPSKTNG